MTTRPNRFRPDRLLKVAQALRESDYPRQFSMLMYQNDCGTPACALGHYAHRTDLQRLLVPTPYGPSGPSYVFRSIVDGISFYDDRVCAHFGITKDEAYELFSMRKGCGAARTTRAAARYIERFVARVRKRV